MSKAKTKASRLKRKAAQPIKLTNRDAEILKALHKYRFLTTDHLQALTQTESRWGMNKRLRLLYDHKYIDRPKAQAAIFSHADKRPTIYALGNKGAELLSNHFGIAMPPNVYWTEKNRRVRERHIEHTLGISDFMIEIEMMCKAETNLHLIDQSAIIAASPPQTRRTKYPFRWKTRITHNGERHDFMIVPDYVFGIRDNEKPEGRNEKLFFVEIDRGTMPVARRDIQQTSFLRKILSYQSTFQCGLALKRFGMKGFQVLTVTTSQQRIQSIQDAITGLEGKFFSANTFLFKNKDSNQAHFPFHSGWQNAKGKPSEVH